MYLLLSLYVNLRVSTTLVTLGSNDLVIVLAKVHAVAGPSVKVVLHVYAATDALGRAYRPILLEGSCAVDGRLVDTGRHRDIIRATIGLEASLALRTTAGVVGAIRFDHIVFHKRVAGPSVHSKVAIALRIEGSPVVDGAGKGDKHLQTALEISSTHRPFPGFHPFPPTKLPVLRQVTEYLLPSPMVYTAEPPPSLHPRMNVTMIAWIH
jgi:hypothetical protein